MSANATARDGTAPLVVARGLTKHYDGRRVVRDADLTLAAGETLAITGANGSGKSTLLRLLATTARPDAGTLTVAGLDAVRDADQARRHLALVPQDPPLYAELTALEHVQWWARAAGRQGDPQRALADAGLAQHGHRRAGTLSRGQRQRLAIAMAAFGDPDLLLLDEPFTALDADGRAWLESLLAARRGRKATVLALHGDDAHRLADRVLHLDRHRLAPAGRTAEVLP